MLPYVERRVCRSFASYLTSWVMTFSNCLLSKDHHKSPNTTPEAFSITMYSTPTGLESLSKLHAKTFSTGICNWYLRKSMVATSLAVRYRAGTAFRNGILAITSWPSSIVNRNTRLKPPSASFLMETHLSRPTDSAAILCRFTTSNETYRSSMCCFSL